MPSSHEDRATREIDELRRLFAEPPRRVTARPNRRPDAGAGRGGDDPHGSGGPGPTEADQDAGDDGAADAPGADLREAGATAADAADVAQAGNPADTGGERSPSGHPPPPGDPPPRTPKGSVSSRSLAAMQEHGAPGPVPEEDDGQEDRDAVEPPAWRLTPAESSPAPPPAPQPQRRTLPAVLVVALLLAAAFGLGAWIGFGLDAGRQPAAASPGPSGVAPPVHTETTAPAAQTSVPQACLDTARLADRVIDLLVANRRGRELDGVLRAYGQASQRCRAAAAG
jgi:hypothetical protein